MKATRETSTIYAGRERIAYRLSEPLSDRTYPFYDTLTNTVRFRGCDLVMVWGENGEHLSPCSPQCQVTDYTPVVADRERVLAAIREWKENR